MPVRYDGYFNNYSRYYDQALIRSQCMTPQTPEEDNVTWTENYVVTVKL